jgi:hypothetical protein
MSRVCFHTHAWLCAGISPVGRRAEIRIPGAREHVRCGSSSVCSAWWLRHSPQVHSPRSEPRLASRHRSLVNSVFSLATWPTRHVLHRLSLTACSWRRIGISSPREVHPITPNCKQHVLHMLHLLHVLLSVLPWSLGRAL